MEQRLMPKSGSVESPDNTMDIKYKLHPERLLKECLYYDEKSKLKYSWWGESSIEVEKFCRDIIAETALKMTAKQFQYTASHGTDALKLAIIDHFSEHAHYSNASIDNIYC